MAQTNVNIRMDEDLKKQFEQFCSDVGMSMTTAFCIFAKATVRKQKLPFEVEAGDPFYSESNMSFIRDSLDQIARGKVVVKTMDELEAMANE